MQDVPALSSSTSYVLDKQVPAGIYSICLPGKPKPTKESTTMDIQNFKTLVNDVLPPASYPILESMGCYNGTLAYLIDNGHLSKFVDLCSAESVMGVPIATMVNVILMSQGAMIPGLTYFKKSRVSSRTIKDPWQGSWLDSAKSEMAERICAYAQTQVRPILEHMCFEKGADGAIPSSGLPSEIVAHLNDPEVTEEQLMIDFFHSQLSHTVLLKGGLTLPAVNYRGETLIADSAGNAKTVNVSFGWRADGCRKTKKKAPKSDATPAADAALPEE